MPRNPRRPLPTLLSVGGASLLLAFGAAAPGGTAALVAVLVLGEVLAALGTALEAALEHHSRTGVLLLAEERSAREAIAARLGRTPSYLVTARLARSLGTVLLLLALTAGFLRASGPGEAAGAAALLGALATGFAVSFLLNDLLVRVLSERAADRVLLAALPAAALLHLLLAPVRWPVVALVRVLFGVRLDEAPPDARAEILETVGEAEREGRFTPEEAAMVESIMGLHRRTVGDLLVPRADVVMIQADTPLPEAVRILDEEGYSRIPVYGRDRDDVVGVLYARDLLTRWPGGAEAPAAPATVRELMRPAYFVPLGKLASDLLQEMRRRKTHFAVVLDEFNGTAGIVSIEDLLEQIVGQIQDEYDEEDLDAPAPRPRGDGTLEIEGRTPIEDLNRLYDLELPLEEDFETVGGLVFHRLGRVPVAGDQVQVGRARLTVIEADDRTARRLELAPGHGEALGAGVGAEA